MIIQSCNAASLRLKKDSFGSGVGVGCAVGSHDSPVLHAVFRFEDSNNDNYNAAKVVVHGLWWCNLFAPWT